MNRTILAFIVALSALPIAAPVASNACAAGDTHGWFLWHDDAAPGSAPYGRQLKMEIDGWYEGYGAWKMTIKRRTQTIVIQSPGTGAPAAGLHGTLQKGDAVTAYVFKPRGHLMFGNVGCASLQAEGFTCTASPASPAPPFKCSYVAKRDGMYLNSGSWTLEIKRGCNSKGARCKKVILLKNPTTPGGVGYGSPGVIKKGDRVTGTLKTPGTNMLVGSGPAA